MTDTTPMGLPRMSETGSSRPHALPWLWLSAALVGFDQWSKQLALDWLRFEGNAIPFIEGLWDWKLAFNRGAAFSLLADHGGWQHWLFSGLAIVVSAVIVVLLRRMPRGDWRNALPFALVVAGALGNLVDRIRYGYVVDFVDWYVGDYHWPVFNIADSCIVVGVALILLFGLREGRRTPAG
jgi:signal peptidase II